MAGERRIQPRLLRRNRQYRASVRADAYWNRVPARRVLLPVSSSWAHSSFLTAYGPGFGNLGQKAAYLIVLRNCSSNGLHDPGYEVVAVPDCPYFQQVNGGRIRR